MCLLYPCNANTGLFAPYSYLKIPLTLFFSMISKALPSFHNFHWILKNSGQVRDNSDILIYYFMSVDPPWVLGSHLEITGADLVSKFAFGQQLKKGLKWTSCGRPHWIWLYSEDAIKRHLFLHWIVWLKFRVLLNKLACLTAWLKRLDAQLQRILGPYMSWWSGNESTLLFIWLCRKELVFKPMAVLASWPWCVVFGSSNCASYYKKKLFTRRMEVLNAYIFTMFLIVYFFCWTPFDINLIQFFVSFLSFCARIW